MTDETAEGILASIEGLGITTEGVSWRHMLRFARRFDRSAYDAAYLALAEARGEQLVTGDRRLYNAVHGELDWVKWIGEASAPCLG